MKIRKWISHLKKSLFTLSVIILCVFLFTSESHAYSSSNPGASKIYAEGFLYLKINGGPNGNSSVRIRVYRSSAPAWSTFNNSSTSWNVQITGGTNNHNIRLGSTSISTQPDTTPEYNTFSIPIVYDMPAHYVYSSWSADKAPPNSRLNFKYYNQDNTGSNSASETGGHNSSTTSRSINIQVNATQIGIRTYSKVRYWDPSITLNVAKPTRTVTQYHYYNHVRNGWTHFNTTTTTITDGNWFAPYNVTSPTGYYAGNNYGYYSSGGTYIGGGTVGSNGFTVCDNNTVHVHYYPNSYYLDLNGYLDGSVSGGISGFGTADVYVNGNLVANDVSDFYTAYPYGSTYQITDIKSTTGHTYNGIYSGSLSGTIGGNTGVYLSFSTNSYTNTIAHWKYVGSGGDNGSGTHKYMGSTTFTGYYGRSVSIPTSHVQSYTGYYNTGNAGSGSFGSWQSYTIGSNFTQPASGVYFEYYYNPITYTATYHNNGGTGSPDATSFYMNGIGGSWTSYLSSTKPTRSGYTFIGWKCRENGYTLQSGQRIPDGWGTMNLDAQWTANNYTVTYDGNGGTWNGQATWSNLATYDSNYVTEENFFTRSGYTFTGWNEKPDGTGTSWTDWIGKPWKWSYTKDVTLYAQWASITTVDAPILTHPDQNEILPFISDGKLVIQQHDKFTPLNYVQAIDTKDGNISTHLAVKSMTIPLTNSIADVSGEFEVVYTVKNSDNVITDKKMIVIVNEPPKLSVIDRFFFKNQKDVDIPNLLNKMSATDKEDGNITDSIKVKSIDYGNENVDTNVSILDTSKEADYKIIYSLTDQYKKTVEEEAVLHVVTDVNIENKTYKKSMRMINISYIDQLNDYSIWKTDDTYRNQLTQSLDKQTPMKTISLSHDELNNAKEFSINKIPSASSNEEFKNNFEYP